MLHLPDNNVSLLFYGEAKLLAVERVTDVQGGAKVVVTHSQQHLVSC